MRTSCVHRLAVLVLIGFLAVPAYTYTKMTDDAPGSTFKSESIPAPAMASTRCTWVVLT
jgi:hypothetical protein